MNVDDQRITQNKLSGRGGSQNDQEWDVGRGGSQNDQEWDVGRYCWKQMINPTKYFW